ncbi:MAG: CapA family protein [Pseudomonadota bacterium]|nr:CapA family protein [Pseudomonadota bacterium]
MLVALVLACHMPAAVPAPATQGEPIATVAAPAPEPPPPEPPKPPPPPPRVRMLAAGDIIPHPSVLGSAETHGWDSLFTEVKEVVGAADLAIVNLETPLASALDGNTAEKVFYAPVALAEAVRDAGFDAVSIANNHVWDQGRAGLVETVGHLDAVGLAWAGAGRTCAEAEAYRIFERNGLTIGWVAASRVHNLYLNGEPADPCVFKFDPARVIAVGQAARAAGAELVVLSVHWGQEYEAEPRSWERNYAKMLVAGGFDVILGHHPHVLQPIEWVEHGGRRGLVAYSLGNFLSGQSWAYSSPERGLRRDGGLLELVMERVDGVAAVTSAKLLPTWTEHGAVACAGRPARVRAILLGPSVVAAEADPATQVCAAHYRQRIAAVRDAVGRPFSAE